MAFYPKRQAALIAEELNRAEIAKGLPDDEEDEEDEEYVAPKEEEEEEAEHKEKQQHSRKRSKNLQAYTTRIKNQAEDLFASLEPALKPACKQVLLALKRECAEEMPMNPKKRRHGGEKLWIDPRLESYLAPSTAEDEANEKEISTEAMETARQVIELFGTTRVTEQVRFAGEMINVTKTLDKQDVAAASTKAKSTLEEMLEGLSKKRLVTTVEKSSYDWEKYKQDNKLEEELQDAGKDGYVAKQQFLNRVDANQFELERAQRDRERALRDLKA